MATLYNVTRDNTDIFADNVVNATLIRKVYFSYLVILIPITLLGNALVGVVIFLSSKLRKEPVYVLLTSLAAADILFGVLPMPIKAAIEWNDGYFHFPWIVCWLFQLGEIIFFVSSITHLFVLSVDRYFALKYTYEYKVLMCKRIHFSVILFVWTFSVVWSILGIFQWNFGHDFSIPRDIKRCVIINRVYLTTTYILCFVAPVCLIILIYLFTYQTVRGHVNAVSLYDLGDTSALREKNIRNQQFKRLMSIMIVFGAYAICWMPYVIFKLITYYDDTIQGSNKQTWFVALRFVVINFLPNLSASLNPILYVIFNKEFSCCLRKLFYKALGNKLIGSYSYRRRNRHSMPADLAGILYSDEEDDAYELEVLTQAPDSPPRRRFTL